jgi:hypothetical protein
MNRWKFHRNTSRLILALASLLTLIIIVITGVSSYAVTPDTAFAYIVKFQGNGLTLGTGDIRNRQPVSLKDKLEGNKVLYIPGGNKPWAHLGFAVDYPKDFAQLIVKAGPHPDVSEWSFPCTAKGGLTIAWKRGDEKACKDGVKLQSSSKKSGLPNNNLQASRRLLAQAEDEVTVVPTPGESVIQTADTFTGISVSVLVGDVRVKSAKNPEGRPVKAGERYDYPQDTITPIDINPIVNSPEMQEFLNPDNWRSPNIPERVADGIVGQLGEMRTALGKGAPAVASNSGNNNNSGQPPLNQSPQQTASQSTQPQRTTTQSTQSNNWILEFPVYPVYETCGDASTATTPLVLTGSSFSGQMGWYWGGQQYYSPISGTITGNNIQLSFSSPDAVVYPYILNGSMNNKGEFVGTARIVDGPCGGRSGPFTLRPESVAQNNYCNSGTITQPTFSSNSHDGTPYRIWMDFSRGQEVSSAVCGRQYWVKEDPNHPNYQIRFVYLVDGQGKCVVPYLYKETDGGTLEVVRPAPECSSGS